MGTNVNARFRLAMAACLFAVACRTPAAEDEPLVYVPPPEVVGSYECICDAGHYRVVIPDIVNQIGRHLDASREAATLSRRMRNWSTRNRVPLQPAAGEQA